MRKEKKNVLALDAGALLFKRQRLAPDELPQVKRTASGIVDSYNVMGYDAVGISGHDLAAGLDFLVGMQKKSQFTWLSANLVKKSTHEPIFTPLLVRKVDDLKIGLIGLTNPAAANLLAGREDVTLLPWQQTLPEALKKLGQQSDLIILLSSLPRAENKKIAIQVPGIHLIVQAGTETTNLPPRLIGNTLIMQTEKQGKHVGVLDIAWHKSKTWGTARQDLLIEKKNDLDRTNWLLKRYRKKGDPETVYAREPRKLETYRNLMQHRRQLIDEIKDMKMVAGRRSTAPSTFKNIFVPMTTSLPDDPAVLAIVDQTTRDVNQLGKTLRRERLVRGDGKMPDLSGPNFPYGGWKSCAACHAKETDAWRKTRHARAFQTLVERNQQFNLKCVVCHVTGVKTGNEAFALALPPELQQVGCEVCHGPGKKHANDPKQAMVKDPSRELCLRCHTPERDDHFDFAKDSRRVH